MKKAIKRFWGVGLIVIILSSLIVAPASVSGDAYSFGADTTQPTATNRIIAPVAGFGINDVAQTADGATIYAVGQIPAGAAETVTATVTVTFVDGGDTAAEVYSVSYIDQDGVASTGVLTIPAGSVATATVALTLAAGDTGVIDVTAIAATTVDATAGAFSLATDTTATALGTSTYVPVFTNGASLAQTKYLYKSTNGGTTWTPCNGTGATGAVSWDLVAVAPDNASIVVVVSTFPTVAGDVAYLSTNGGATFSSLGTPAAGMTVNDIAISAQSGSSRYIALAGNTVTPAAGSGGGALYIWNYGSTVPAWYDIDAGGGSPAWTALGTAVDDYDAVAFSTSFVSDQAILAVSEIVGSGAVNGNVSLRIGSFNIRKWDALVDATFPRVLESTTTAVLTCARADITLDPAFYLGDEATQIGFIGAEIMGAAEMGGVYRISTYSSGVLTQILTGNAIGSVAWDGTNLVAAPYVATQPAAGTVISIQRCANALASSPPTFLTSSTAKTPGTGYESKVIINGTNVVAVSRGTNAGVAISSDLGKSFNGVALMNTNLNTVRDLYISPDGAIKYMTVNDGVDTNVWRYMDSKWQRVNIIANSSGNWLVRVSASDTDAVVLALMGGSNMFIATDGGEYKWTARSSSATIQDVAVESKDVIYVAGTSTSIYKSSNGAFTWGPPTNTDLGTLGGGTIYSLTLLADGKMLVGGNAGGVAYYDGSSWTGLNPLAAGGNVLVTATGTATGDTIFAASSTGGANSFGKWKIGTNAPPTNWTAGITLASGATGMAYINGVLYVHCDATNNVYRFLTPTIGISNPFSEDVSDNALAFNMTGVNDLKSSTGSTTLWGINSGTPDSLVYWTEYLATAADAVALTFPTNDYMLQVNSMTGAPNAFVFQWSAPPAVDPLPSYRYQISVYLDAAGKVAIVDRYTTTVAGTTVASGTAGFTPIPGTTYYWRVRVAAGTPVLSAWSEMRTLTVQPLAASVPVISSPSNGSTIKNQSPAFSWAPVTSTTKYEFQLSTTPTFGTTVLTDTPSTAGALVPVTIKLEKGKQYFWRVRALEPVQGDWSTVANFVVAVDEATAAPPVTVTVVPAPTITIPAAPAAPTYTLVPPAEEVIAPTYIWAIIIIGAILVIAVIVLIVRTRRSV